jgi:hypothetical protein
MNFWLIYSVALGIALIDIAVKEWMIKGWLLPRKYGTIFIIYVSNAWCNDWNKVPNFWKDSIPGGRWYRIRWSYVLTGAGIIFTWYWLGLPSAVAFWWLIFCNAESIFYQWFKKLVHLQDDTIKWFDLQDKELWMANLPFNMWFAVYLQEKIVFPEFGKRFEINPKVIYLVCFLGNIVLFAVNEIMKGV